MYVKRISRTKEPLGQEISWISMASGLCAVLLRLLAIFGSSALSLLLALLLLSMPVALSSFWLTSVG